MEINQIIEYFIIGLGIVVIVWALIGIILLLYIKDKYFNV